jgi:hypothetical protein
MRLASSRDGHGSTTLPQFIATTRYYDVFVFCSGPGSLEVARPDGSTLTEVQRCTSLLTGNAGGGLTKPGTRIALVITADPTTRWEIRIYESSVSLFPQFMLIGNWPR